MQSISQEATPKSPSIADSVRRQVTRVFFEPPSADNTAAATSDETNDSGGGSGGVALYPTPLAVHDAAAAVPDRKYVGAPKPENESKRVQHLCSLDVLSTPPEQRYDRLTNFVAAVRCVLLSFDAGAPRPPARVRCCGATAAFIVITYLHESVHATSRTGTAAGSLRGRHSSMHGVHSCAHAHSALDAKS